MTVPADPADRSVADDGIVVVDKPSGITSHQVVAQVRTPSSVNNPAKILRPNNASPTSTTNVAVNPIDEPIESPAGGAGERVPGAAGVVGESGGLVASAESAGVPVDVVPLKYRHDQEVVLD